MLDEIHKGMQSLEEAVNDLQKTLFDLPRLETELATLLKLAGEPDSRFQAVRMVSLPSAMDFNVVVSIDDLVKAKRQELLDAMLNLHKAHENASEAYERLLDFNSTGFPDTASVPLWGVHGHLGDIGLNIARDNANEVA